MSDEGHSLVDSSSESRPLAGRVAVVTGAAQGIGAAIALAFARAGAQLALCDRNVDALDVVVQRCSRAGSEVEAGGLDVRDAAAVDEWVTAVAGRFGAIDALVNNAGGGFSAPFLDVTAKGQAALVDENFTSVTTFVRAVVPHFPPPVAPRAGGGAIVNITSIEAHRAAPTFAVYAAMKAAVANLTKTLALELAGQHVRVNCVAPDVIPTEGLGEIPVRTPLPYAGHVDDVAAAALYLVADASRFVTGTTLFVDGGNHAAGGWLRQADGSYTV
jgi:NAD(P)-dependent dehydrogenase (short-subunit alcohol dehydrogenase family)